MSAEESEMVGAYKVPSMYADRIYYTDLNGALGRITFSEGRITNDGKVDPNHRVAVTMTLDNIKAMHDLISQVLNKYQPLVEQPFSPKANALARKRK